MPETNLCRHCFFNLFCDRPREQICHHTDNHIDFFDGHFHCIFLP